MALVKGLRGNTTGGRGPSQPARGGVSSGSVPSNGMPRARLAHVRQNGVTKSGPATGGRTGAVDGRPRVKTSVVRRGVGNAGGATASPAR